MKIRILLLFVALLAALGLPSTASAKKNPYTAEGVCGPGYRAIDRHRLHDYVDGRLIAVVVLTYNASNGNNCAVTLKRYRVGRETRFDDFLMVRLVTRPINNANIDAETGNFKYFAGPVYVSAPDKCMQWGGRARLLKPANHEPRGYYESGEYRSRWEHCG
jgi:hypothetical protein